MNSLDMVEGGKELCGIAEPERSSSNIVAIIFTAGVAIGVVIGVIVGCVLVKFFTVEHAGNPAVASRMDLRSRAGEPCAAREPLLTEQEGQQQPLQPWQQHEGTPEHQYLILSGCTVVELKSLLAICGLRPVGNKPELIQRMIESRRMICGDRCRGVLAQQACDGVRMPVEFLANEHRADAWIKQVRR